jgi:Putative lumazine-binding
MRWIITIATLVFFTTFQVSAQQSAEDKAALEPVRILFKGMMLGDSAMVRSAFAKEVTMASVFRDKQNNATITRESSLEGFLNAVGTPHPDQWNEEIWNIEVKRDGDLAQVWCSYAFYRGQTFSHCGIDAFHVFKDKEGWKIFHLADTRRTEDCQVPEDIQRRYRE